VLYGWALYFTSSNTKNSALGAEIDGVTDGPWTSPWPRAFLAMPRRVAGVGAPPVVGSSTSQTSTKASVLGVETGRCRPKTRIRHQAHVGLVNGPFPAGDRRAVEHLAFRGNVSSSMRPMSKVTCLPLAARVG